MIKTSEWPKIKVMYHGPRPSEILTLEEAAKKYGLDEREINWMRTGGLHGTSVNKSPHGADVYMLRRYTLEDSIAEAGPDLLEALKEVVSILPPSQEKLMKLGLDAWIYDAKAAIKKAETGEAL